MKAFVPKVGLVISTIPGPFLILETKLMTFQRLLLLILKIDIILQDMLSMKDMTIRIVFYVEYWKMVKRM
ncbi:MAG: hypothetical protein BWY74_04447 [Firmicutes bacterium ADurb.Bin419]|nr:MAG: hypothetical protein BWY74_04447 [Firmicutes bacterium ADurb.Bin419]